MNIIKVAWRQLLKNGDLSGIMEEPARSNRPVVRCLEVRNEFGLVYDGYDISLVCRNEAVLKTTEIEIL